MCLHCSFPSTRRPTSKMKTYKNIFGWNVMQYTIATFKCKQKYSIFYRQDSLFFFGHNLWYPFRDGNSISKRPKADGCLCGTLDTTPPSAQKTSSYQNDCIPRFIFKFKFLIIALCIYRLESKTSDWYSISTLMFIHYNLQTRHQRSA